MIADEEPRPENMHGLYALKTRDEAAIYLTVGRVIGQVGLLGHVLEGERGYRAERAVVRELWLHGAPHADVPAILEEYGLSESNIHPTAEELAVQRRAWSAFQAQQQASREQMERESLNCAVCGLRYRAIREWQQRCPNNNCTRH